MANGLGSPFKCLAKEITKEACFSEKLHPSKLTEPFRISKNQMKIKDRIIKYIKSKAV